MELIEIIEELVEPKERGWFSEPVTEFERKYIFGLWLCAFVVIPLCFIILAGVYLNNVILIGIGIVYVVLQVWVTISAYLEFVAPVKTEWVSFCGLKGDLGYLKGILVGVVIAVITIICFGLFSASIKDYKLLQLSLITIPSAIPLFNKLISILTPFTICLIIPWIEESYFRAMVVSKLSELGFPIKILMFATPILLLILYITGILGLVEVIILGTGFELLLLWLYREGVEYFGGPLLGVLGSAILFPLFHVFVYGQSVGVLLSLTVFSILSSICVVVWRTYLPGFVAHVIINTLAYLQA